MEYHESNKNKTKNWLCRLLKFRRNQFNHKPDNVIAVEEEPPETPTPPTLLLSQNGDIHRRSPDSTEVRAASSSSSETSETPPPVSPRHFDQPVEQADAISTPLKILTDDINTLKMYYWYWGPLSTADAEEVLQFKPDGSFLVRDSSSTSYLFSISFRSVGSTLHSRIEYNRGKYNLYGSFTDGYPTIPELIDDAVKTSENAVYCYSKRGEHYCDFPVRLTKPISRYTQVRSLKYLARFVIRQYTNINDIPKLPLPTTLSGYLLETPYF